MHEAISAVLTISRWEVKRSLTTMGRNVLPVAALLFILLILATGFAQQQGVHLQDGMYAMATDSPDLAAVIAEDPRFRVTLVDANTIPPGGAFDLAVIGGRITVAKTDRAQAALAAFTRDYARYETWVYTRQDDLFAAYPLWIDEIPVKSELDFLATQQGQTVGALPRRGAPPVPEGTVEIVATPSASLSLSPDDLRGELAAGAAEDPQVSRYAGVLAADHSDLAFKTPSQLSPPLPFDSIILIFVFIFPLYFTSQFFMMSIMNERVDRKGEVLLTTPARPWQIIAGKALPYLALMVAVSLLLTLANGASMTIMLPLLPVILFFLAFALFIGMVSRSFKELSFLSIFFSTVATSYLFFPSIFANVHVISLISPLTLIVLQVQGEAVGAMEYFYATSLFWLTSAVLFALCTANFTEERLFTSTRLLSTVRAFVGSALSLRRPHLSVFLAAACTIPFVFMAQLMLLVVLFNLPMPLSLVTLLLGAACVEECAKAVPLYALARKAPGMLTWPRLATLGAAIALGFLAGEKALLFATLAQISESVFGAVLFTSLQALWFPLSLHFIGVFITGSAVMAGGRRALLPGILAASLVHSLYNLGIILGWAA
ncbi:MAG: PrsW family intramembrane metalloprotease [Methanomicrobiaceae archaeon]|nr:PrsW family intramembrane metalloprotease [Methanomicrobiaceae archaeon]